MSGLRAFLARWAADRGGAPAVEFALILPMLVVMLAGVISTAQLAGAVSGLNHAALEAARCSAINAPACATSAATEAYALARYRATSARPDFDVAQAACGRRVTGALDYELSLGFTSIDIPLSATACFPVVDYGA